MKVLVTGATGFTASHLVKGLCREGIQVRALIRNSHKIDVFKGLDVETVEGDITNIDFVDTAVQGVEKVFHIAAAFRTAGITDQVYRDVHVKATENLLNASLKHNVKRFIHCSTGGVHGHIEHPPANENYRFKPGDIYQETKLEGELEAVNFGKENGLPVTVIRPSPIYGPGDMRLYKLFKMVAKKIVLILGSGEIFYHMVYVEDLVEAFIQSAENEKAIGETFIIGGEEACTLNKLLDVIAEAQKKEIIKVRLPVKPFLLLGDICEKICIPLKLEPPIYRRRVDFFTKSRSFDISKAKNILDFKPKFSLQDGIAITNAWYKDQGLL